MTDHYTLTSQQILAVSQAKDDLRRKSTSLPAIDSIDGAIRFTDVLDLSVNCGKILAGQHYADLGIDREKTIATLRSAATELGNQYDYVATLRTLADELENPSPAATLDDVVQRLDRLIELLTPPVAVTAATVVNAGGMSHAEFDRAMKDQLRRRSTFLREPRPDKSFELADGHDDAGDEQEATR